MLSLFFLTFSLPAQSPPDTLILQDYFVVEGPPNCQPSGLTICDDVLYTISDKHDDAIFRLDFQGDKVRLRPVIRFTLPDPEQRGWFDFEGITCDGEGNFYLISETRFQILKVRARDGQFAWISPNLKPAGQAVGLFQIKNAYAEGLARAGEQRFWVAAERQPRGLIRVELDKEPAQIHAYLLNQSRFSFPEGVSTDFAGLYWYRGRLFALVRNAYVFCELIATNEGIREGRAWSFHELAEREEFRYEDMRYGHAEGLAIDDRYVYIILDNNGDARVVNRNDRRPLFFRFLNPITHSAARGDYQ